MKKRRIEITAYRRRTTITLTSKSASHLIVTRCAGGTSDTVSAPPTVGEVNSNQPQTTQPSPLVIPSEVEKTIAEALRLAERAEFEPSTVAVVIASNPDD